VITFKVSSASNGLQLIESCARFDDLGDACRR
jgi:hypothetical protein